MKIFGEIKNFMELVYLGIADRFTFRSCVLWTQLELDDGTSVGSCMCDPVGDCSLKYEGKCWITGKGRPFMTSFKFRRMVAKGKVFNCVTHEWEDGERGDDQA